MSMDLATIFGLLVSFALLALAIALGGSFVAFMNVPSLMIVIGGTFAITLVCFSFSEVMRAQSIMVKSIFNRIIDPGEAAHTAMELAARAPQTGVLGTGRNLSRLKLLHILHVRRIGKNNGVP